jgi:hypothetical protein
MRVIGGCLLKNLKRVVMQGLNIIPINKVFQLLAPFFAKFYYVDADTQRMTENSIHCDYPTLLLLA